MAPSRAYTAHLAARLSRHATSMVQGAASWAQARARSGAEGADRLYDQHLHPHLASLPQLSRLPDLRRLPHQLHLPRLPYLLPRPRRVLHSDDYWSHARSIPPLARRLLALAVVAALALVAYSGLLAYGQHIADNASVEVQLVRVLGSGPSHLDLEVTVEIRNPAPLDVDLQPGRLGLYQGQSLVGELDLPALHLRRGYTTHILPLQLVQHRPGSLVAVASAMLSGDGEPLTLRGEVQAHSVVDMTLAIDKPMSLGGFDELAIEVDSIEVDTASGTGIDITLGVAVDNPSNIEVLLDGLGFDILFDGQPVDSVTPTGWLLRGFNRLDFQLHIPASAHHVYDPLVQAVVNGDSANFTIQGQSAGADGPLLAAMASTFTFQYALDASGGMDISVDSVRVRELGLFSSTVAITALVDNPGPVSADLSDFELKIFERERLIGQGSLPGAELVPGRQTIGLELTVDTLSLYNLGLIGRIILEDEVELTVELYRDFAGGESLRLTIPVTLDAGTSIL